MTIPPPPSPCSEDVIRGLIETAETVTLRLAHMAGPVEHASRAIAWVRQAAQALTALVEERERASRDHAPTSDSALEEAFPSAEDLAAIGAVGRKPTVSKHRAMNLGHIRDVIVTLDARDLHAEADTVAWLVWWRVLDHQREEFLLADANERVAAAEAPLSSAEQVAGESSRDALLLRAETAEREREALRGDYAFLATNRGAELASLDAAEQQAEAGARALQEICALAASAQTQLEVSMGQIASEALSVSTALLGEHHE